MNIGEKWILEGNSFLFLKKNDLALSNFIQNKITPMYTIPKEWH